MDWQALLNVALIVIFFLLMMRGCGGMRGGCGAPGGRTRRDPGPRTAAEHDRDLREPTDDGQARRQP